MIPYSFELAFAMPVLNKWTDMYSLSDNHCKHDRNLEHNEFPFVRLDPRDQLWDKLPDTKGELENLVLERFYEDHREWMEESGEFDEFKTCFDMNGYRLLALVPLKDLWSEREQFEEAIKDSDNDTEEIKLITEDIEKVDKELVKCAKFLLWFEMYAEELEHYFDDYVVVYSGDIEENNFDFVHKEWYEEMKEEYDWHIWDSDIEEHIEEGSKELVENSILESINIKKASQEGINRAKNSMVG